jgi:hypothetical protein
MKKYFYLIAGMVFLLILTPPVSSSFANPYKVVWQACPSGSEVEYVIRCRLEGGEECFANWQGHCDESPSTGG